MEFKQYQIETLRTFAYRDKPLPEQTTDMLHCAIGFSTEVGELIEAFMKEQSDTVNIAEEIADQMWYISNLANFIGFDLSTVELFTELEPEISDEDLAGRLTVLQGKLLDVFKKHIFYGKELERHKLKEILYCCVLELNNLSNYLDFNLGDLLDKNIAKLKIRFPDKFTSENALNRNLTEERKTLES